MKEISTLSERDITLLPQSAIETLSARHLSDVFQSKMSILPDTVGSSFARLAAGPLRCFPGFVKSYAGQLRVFPDIRGTALGGACSSKLACFRPGDGGYPRIGGGTPMLRTVCEYTIGDSDMPA
jgi:hypothetical protein